MATNITTNATVNINANGQNALKTLEQLREKSSKIKEEIAQIEAGNGPNKAKRLADLRRQFQDVEKQIRQCTTEAGRANEILSRLGSASPKELNDALRTLKSQLNSIQRGSEGWNAHVRKIQAVEAEIRRTNAAMRTQQGLLQRVNNWWNNCMNSVMVAAGALSGLVLAGRKSVNMFLEMDEQMQNTRKYTGLSEQGVKNLNEAFKKTDTRVSREELNLLAQEAGRLGKNTVDSVKAYVDAAKIIKVALVDLGEGATQEIAKLTNIFGVEQQMGTRRAMLATASAINVLSQNSSASKQYLVEFSKRMAGIGASAGLSIPEIVAFGAVLDANGQKCEMSATAIQKIISALSNQNKEFSQILGLDERKMRGVLRRSAKDGIIMYLEAIKKLTDKTSFNNSTMTLAPLFKDMGMDAARVSAVLATLANHLGEVRAQVKNANVAFNEASSATREYNIFNNTATASVEKAKNKMKELAVELGEKLYPVMRHIYTTGSMFIRVLNNLVTFLSSNWKAIVALTSAIVAYSVAVSAATLKTKLFAAASTASTVAATAGRAALLLLQAAYALLTLNTSRAAAAMRMFSAVTKASPVGLLVGVVTALATAIALATAKTDEFKKKADEAMKSAESFAEETAKEKKELDRLFGVLDKAEKGTKEYADAKNAIISGYSVYLKGLINEKGEITDLALAYDRLTFAAQKSARERGIRNGQTRLDETYYQEIDDLTEQLRGKLEEMGMDDRKLSGLITEISQAIGLGKDMPVSALQEITAFQLRYKPGMFDWLKEKPMDIVDKIIDRQKDYNTRTEKLSQMSTRAFQEFDSDALLEVIEELNNAIGITPSPDVNVTLKLDDKSKKAVEAIVGHKFTGINWDITRADTGTKAENFHAMPVPYDRNLVSGSLTRQQAEMMMRELIFEAQSRGLQIKDRQEKSDGNSDKGKGFQGYQSNKLSEAEEKAEQAKAAKRFKEGLDRIKADYKKTEAIITAMYNKGTLGYENMLKRRYENDVKYCNRALGYYKKHLSKISDLDVEKDKDYQALQERKNNAKLKYNEKLYAHQSKIVKTQSEEHINRIKLSYDSKTDKTLMDEINMLKEIYEVRQNAVAELKNMLPDQSKEWQELHLESFNMRRAEMEETEALFQKKVNELRKAYAKQGAHERYRIELSVLESLLRAEKIKTEEFEKWKAELQKKFRAELPGADFDRNPGQQAEETLRKMKKAYEEIDKAQAEGLIDGNEAKARKNKVQGDALKPALDKLKESSEWNKLLVDMSQAWVDVWDSMDKNAEDVLKNVSKAASATFATVAAGMQMALQFSKAKTQQEVAAIEKRYDREKELAQGNSYLISKLEKEKQKKVAEAKNKASEKEFKMQVINAIAQSITGAINAYTSAAAVPMIGYILAPVAAGVALAAGMANVALLQEQQKAAKAQGYRQGGYTAPGKPDEVAGVVHAGEWVASQSLVNDPQTGPVIAMLETIQRTGPRPVFSRADASRATAAGAVAQLGKHETQDREAVRVVQVNAPDDPKLRETLDRLARRLDEPFVTVNTVTGDNGIKQVQDEYNTLMKNRRLRR